MKLGTYGHLAARPENDPWHFIGLSGQQLLDEATDAALESAQQAAALDDGLADAHFQIGLVLAKRQDWQGAAAALDRAAELNPSRLRAMHTAASCTTGRVVPIGWQSLRAVPEAGA